MLSSKRTIFLALLAMYVLSTDAFSVEPATSVNKVDNRRTFLSKAFISTATILGGSPVVATASTSSDLVEELKVSVSKMESIPQLLDEGEWDKVRTILKTPPVNKLWNLGESQNTLVTLAKETGEFELLELKDELAISLQMCDQLTYDNAFVYFQPGNGKVKIKEPKDLALKAMGQIQDAIKLSSN